MREITAKSVVSGNDVRLRYTYHEEIRDKIAYADGYNIPIGKEKHVVDKLEVWCTFYKKDRWENVSIITVGEPALGGNNAKAEEICKKHGISKYLRHPVYIEKNGEMVTNYMHYLVSQDDVERIEKMIAEEKEANRDPEVIEYDARKAAEQRQSKIRLYRGIIEQSKNTPTLNGKLMTAEEARKWKIAYNNVNNEGGEGYVPEVITQEDYDRAISELKILENE